jgi:hypothetical protein
MVSWDSSVYLGRNLVTLRDVFLAGRKFWETGDPIVVWLLSGGKLPPTVQSILPKALAPEGIHCLNLSAAETTPNGVRNSAYDEQECGDDYEEPIELWVEA